MVLFNFPVNELSTIITDEKKPRHRGTKHLDQVHVTLNQ